MQDLGYGDDEHTGLPGADDLGYGEETAATPSSINAALNAGRSKGIQIRNGRRIKPLLGPYAGTNSNNS